VCAVGISWINGRMTLHANATGSVPGGPTRRS